MMGMFSTKTHQFLYEMNTWLRALAFMQDETANLKNRMAEVVSNNMDRSVLPQMENYQNLFLQEDVIMALLKHDVQQQIKLLQIQADGGDHFEKQVESNQLRIRNEMEKAEREFNKLRSDFNSYVSDALSY